jgi:hypothetical protein
LRHGWGRAGTAPGPSAAGEGPDGGGGRRQRSGGRETGGGAGDATVGRRGQTTAACAGCFNRSRWPRARPRRRTRRTVTTVARRRRGKPTERRRPSPGAGGRRGGRGGRGERDGGAGTDEALGRATSKTWRSSARPVAGADREQRARGGADGRAPAAGRESSRRARGGRRPGRMQESLIPYWRENPNPRIGWGCVLIIMSWAWPITEGQESKCTHTLI